MNAENPLLKSSRRTIGHNSAFILFSRVTEVVIGIASFAMLARYFDVEVLGRYILIVAFALFAGRFINFGYCRIITREIVRDEQFGANCFGMSILAAFSAMLLLIALPCGVLPFVNIDRMTGYAVIVAIFNQFLIAAGLISISVFNAFERMEYQLIIKFIFSVVYIGLLSLVIVMDMGFLPVFLARTVASLFQAGVLLLFAARKFLKPVFALSLHKIGHFFKEAWPVGLYAVLLTSFFKFDVFVINQLRGVAEVSFFEPAHRIVMELQHLPMSFALALFPLLSTLAQKDVPRLRYVFYKTFKVILLVSILFAILLAFYAETVVFILFGTHLGEAARALKILSWTIPPLFLINLQSLVIVAEGRQFLNMVSAAVCLIVNIVLDYLLVPGFGYIGASWATLFSYTLFFLFSFYFIGGTVGFTPLRDILPKPILVCGLTVVFSLVVHPGGSNNLAAVVTGGLLTLVFYATLTYVLKIFRYGEVAEIKEIFFLRQAKE